MCDRGNIVRTIVYFFLAHIHALNSIMGFPSEFIVG